MATYQLDTEGSEQLAKGFAHELGQHARAAHLSTTPWADEARKFLAQASPEALLAWFWERREAFIGDEMRRIDRAISRDRHPGAVLPRQQKHSEARIDAATTRERDRLLTGKWYVPSAHKPMALGSMNKEQLLDVAGAFRHQAADLVARAKFFERLARQLRPGETVAERFTEEDVARWWSTFAAAAV